MLEFGAFRLDPDRREFLRDGEPVPVRPKLFDTLAYLVDHRDRVVEKQELLDSVWPGIHVEESTLFQTVSDLRKALSKGEASGGRYIATIPGRGYRFVAAVKSTVAGAAPRSAGIEKMSEVGYRAAGRIDDPIQRVEAESTPRASRRWATAAAGFAGVVAAVGLWSWSGPTPGLPLSPEALIEVPLTSYAGDEHHPAFSPDGSLMAYARRASPSDDWDIYVEVVRGVPAEAPIIKSPADEFFPAVSPDGSTIAFWQRHSPGVERIMLASTLGGAERPLYVAGDDPRLGDLSSGKLSWSPDGEKIAASMPSEEGGASGLALLSVQTGEVSWLTSPPAGIHGDVMPAFSPDGSTIAFARRQNSNGGHNIFTLALPENGEAVGAPRQLTHFENRASAPAWLPTGEAILFIGQKGRGMEGIWSVPASGGEPQLVWRQPGVDWGPSLTVGQDAQGAIQIAYAHTEPLETDIYEAALSGPERGKAIKLISTTRRDSLAQYSPDGKRIAYYSGWPERDIWVANADGSGSRRLTFHQDRQAQPIQWSPSGDEIVYSSGWDPSADLYIVKAAGGAPRQLTHHPKDEVRPTWSRDGNWVYFSRISQPGLWDLWKAPAGGGEAVPVTQGGLHLLASEATDGETLHFLTLWRGEGVLWRIGVDDLLAEPEQVFSRKGVRIARLSDGGLYFAKHGTMETGPLFYFDMSTGEVEELFDIPGQLSSVHPDGSAILTVHGPPVGSDLKMLKMP